MHQPHAQPVKRAAPPCPPELILNALGRTAGDLVGVAMSDPEAGLEDVDDVVIGEQAASRALNARQQHLPQHRAAGEHSL